MKIGTAKFGFTQKKYFKMKDGDVTFRILPPLGELADEGKWSVFYAVHYGYKNSAGKLRVFQSCEVYNRKSKMIEVPDAAADRIKLLKGELEKAKAAGNKAAMEKIGPLISGQKPMYNLDKNHYLNVIDEQGNIGVLKLRHKAKQALDVQIKKLREKGVDPLSVDNGRFFTFSRSGSGLETTFAVSVTTKTMNIEGVGEVQREVVHKLDAAIISRLKDEAAELNKLFKAPTSEEVARIVKESDLLTGKSPAIDEIIDAKKDDGGSAAGGDGDEGDYEVESDEGQSAAPVAAATTVAAAPVQAQTTVQAAPAQVAPVQAQTAPATVTPPVVEAKAAQAAAPAATTAEAVNEQSDADFLKSLGL